MGADNWETWIGQEATLKIWEMDENGSIGALVRIWDFWQQIRVRPVRHAVTFRQPGVPREERRSTVVGYEIEINCLSQRADQQINPFLDRTKLFRILLILDNTENPALNQSEDHDYRFARPTEGPDQDHNENDSSNLTLSFFAESKE